MSQKLRKPSEYGSLTYMQDFFSKIVKQGHIPRHIAYIMDGNRRFAKERGMTITDGHMKGLETLLNTVNWCRMMGVYALSVYGFSTRNFKRSQVEEVDNLINVLIKAFEIFLWDIDTWVKTGTQFRVIGRLELLPKKLQRLAGQLMEKTASGNNQVIVLAFAYTSRDDMTHAIHQLMEGVERGLIEPEDVSEGLMERSLRTSDLPPIDMLVRTSGEKRLSDFMLWQSTYSYLCFQKVLWPDFGFWNFLGAMLLYQRHAHQLKAHLKSSEEVWKKENEGVGKGTRIANFFKHLDKEKVEYIQHFLLE